MRAKDYLGNLVVDILNVPEEEKKFDSQKVSVVLQHLTPLELGPEPDFCSSDSDLAQP